MGYELRRWLADRLPAGLSSGERLVALEIADQAHDGSRAAYGPDLLEVVTRRTGLSSVKQVGKVLGKLAANGIELRVPVKDANGESVTDKAGRILFACAGHRTTFKVPDDIECPALLVPRPGDQDDAESSPSGETNTQESSPGGETSEAERSPAGGQKVPPAGDPNHSHHSTTTTTAVTDASVTDGDSGTSALFDEPDPAPAAGSRRRKESAEPKPNRHQVADDLTTAFWELHGKGRAQSFISIRGIVRTAIGNGVDRDDCARALDRIARNGRAISGATLDIALGEIRRGGQRTAAPPTAPRHMTDEEKRNALQF
ncbi:hypothetical protein [Streptomyces turgidiscabies]|uniref:hypothetical protein n=1 Tax=Streptomyces turgidiscabies TaxID=85558 RepID=UPI0038F724E4